MNFFHYAITGALVPALVKKVPAALKKIFKLTTFDDVTKERLAAKKYPRYYRLGYILWLLCILFTGPLIFGYITFYLPITEVDFDYTEFWKYAFLGFINFNGALLILGAIIDQIFWKISASHFKDYVRLECIKAGMDVDIPLQIKTLWKIGIWYYVLLSPAIYFLLR